MPAATLARRSAYSACEISGRRIGALVLVARLMGGKLPRRGGDLGRARHEELLLRTVEWHRRHIWPRDAEDRAVEILERVLRDDRGDLGAEPASEVVLVHHHRLARLAHRREDRVAVERREGAEIDDLDAHAVGLELGGGVRAV